MNERKMTREELLKMRKESDSHFIVYNEDGTVYAIDGKIVKKEEED